VKLVKILPYALLTGGAFAIAYYFTKSAVAKPLAPAPIPADPTKTAAPIVKDPSLKTPPGGGPAAPADFKGLPPTVPGFDPIPVACSIDGELNPYTDIEMGRYIDSISDPVVLDNIAASLLAGVPPCTTQAKHATARAATVRDLLAAAKKAQNPWG
jgi:hypothetical protein